MLAQLVDRDVVLRLARRVVEQAGADPGTTGDEAQREALEALRAAVQDESGPSSAEARQAWLPTDATLAFLQAMAEAALAGAGAGSAEGGTVPAQGPLASESLGGGPGVAERVDPFERLDLRWVASFVAALAAHLGARRRFRLPAKPPRRTPLADDARLVLVGDWGTGERIAREVARRIRAELEAAGGRETHVVHLGDVYYAGTEAEARKRFLRHWPVRPEEAHRHHSWCLNANHDMYAAGTGLFEVILRDPRFAAQVTEDGRPASELHLEGRHWQVLGMDSAWRLTGTSLRELRGEAGHFDERQAARLAAATAPGRPPAIVLSHHQPFTRARDGAGEDGLREVGDLLDRTAAARRGGGVAGWFWGHEHRCRTYGTRFGIGYAACVGHGAVPAERRRARQAPGEWELTEAFRAPDGQHWRHCGFAVADLSPEAMVVRYVDHLGRPSKPPDVVPRRGA